MFAGNFAPSGWMACEGQIISISENEVLFQLIGTTYGGNGQSTFGIPDLRGRLPIHQSSGFQIGQKGGSEQVTLNTNQIPSHNHGVVVSSSIANSAGPTNNTLAISSQLKTFVGFSVSDNMNSGTITNTGGSQPHNNMQPSMCVGFIISLYGVFPQQS